MILNFFTSFFDYIMILLIVLNLSLRKFKDGQNKRFSTILLALIILTVYFLLIFIDWLKLAPWCEYIALAIGLGIVIKMKWRQRKNEVQRMWEENELGCHSRQR